MVNTVALSHNSEEMCTMRIVFFIVLAAISVTFALTEVEAEKILERLRAGQFVQTPVPTADNNPRVPRLLECLHAHICQFRRQILRTVTTVAPAPCFPEAAI